MFGVMLVTVELLRVAIFSPHVYMKIFALGHHESDPLKRGSVLCTKRACFLDTVIFPWLAPGERMLLCNCLARSHAALSSFQRQKLDTAEEENRRTAKTMQGKHSRLMFCLDCKLVMHIRDVLCFSVRTDYGTSLGERLVISNVS